MAKQQLYQEVYTIARAVAKSLLILFKMYGPLMKTILIVAIGYVAYHMGRRTVVDPLEEDVKKVRGVLQNRVQYTVELPLKVSKVQRVRKYIMVSLIFTAFLIIGLLYYRVKMIRKIKSLVWVQIALLALVSLISVWMFELYLKGQLRKGRLLNTRINQELFALTKLIGSKGQFLLRAYLCKAKLLAKPKRPQGICWKEDCKQERNYLKIKYQQLQLLVQTGLTFQWCSICKYRNPFNQYLEFEGLFYQSEEGCSEQLEVSQKNKYLLSQVDRIVEWVKSVSPCNCAKIYWNSELKQVGIFKQQEKELEGGFARLRIE